MAALCHNFGALGVLSVSLLLFVVCSLWSTTRGQRTLMRSCECEYVTNGKCAYTLLLPIGQDAAPSTCDSRPNDPDDGTTSDVLDQQLDAIWSNLTTLSDWSSSQAKLLAQLQGSVIAIQTRQQDPDPAGQNPGDGDQTPATDPGLSREVDDLRQTLLSLSRELADVSTDLGSLRQQTDALARSVQDLRSGSVSPYNSSSIAELRSIVCLKRGLIVSGDDQSIVDSEITTSSNFNEAHGPTKARITNTGSPGAWCPQEPNSDYEWLQFGFEVDRLIFGTVLKGRYDFRQWVTTYRVEYSTLATDVWHNVTDIMGDISIFLGNNNQNTPKVNQFDSPVLASAIRIIPLTGNSINKCLRADVIGCLDDVS